MSGEQERAGEAPGEPLERAAGAPGPSAEKREPVTLSYGEYEELMTLAQERDDYLKRLQRAVADYQNLQKRVERSRESAREEILRSLAQEVVPIVDNVERALAAAEQIEGAEGLVKGLRLAEKDFYDALGRLGITPMDPVGRKFDPRYHEAAMQREVGGVAPNTVIEEVRKGFMLGDMVIRPSRVIVAAGCPEDQEARADREEP